jgi:hypothetical protein
MPRLRANFNGGDLLCLSHGDHSYDAVPSGKQLQRLPPPSPS